MGPRPAATAVSKRVSLKALRPEMQKRVDTADISVLIFSYSCANFLGVHAQTDCAVLDCAISTVLLVLCS